MATSGSVNWSMNRNEIIRMAMLDLNVPVASGSLNAQMVKDFSNSLNGMVKAWQTSGRHIWTTKEATLFPQADVSTYTVGSSGTGHVTQTYGQTAIATAAISGATTLTIDSNSGMVDADNIGIALDDGTIHWTTISSSTSTSVTIASALTDSAAVDNEVFFYTSKIVRPLKIIDARRHNISSGEDTPIEVIARRTYRELPLKTNAGFINSLFYDAQLSTGSIYIWQPVSVVSDLVQFTWHRPIEDFDTEGDDPDLPQEFIMALRYSLAETMIPQFAACSKPEEIKRLAAGFRDMAFGYDRENEGVMFQPDLEGYGY